MIYCMQQQLVSHKKSLFLFIFKLALLKKFYFIISCSVNTFLFMMFASLQMLLVIRYPRKEPPHLAISSYFQTYFFHLQPTWAYSFIIFLCTEFTERSAASQTTLWIGPRADIRTRDGLNQQQGHLPLYRPLHLLSVTLYTVVNLLLQQNPSSFGGIHYSQTH